MDSNSAAPAHSLSLSNKLFVCLAGTFIACLLLGDVIGGKTFATPLGPVSVGMIPFPVTFLLTDIVNDFYGRRGARFLTILGFVMAAFAWAILQLTTALRVDEQTYFTQAEYAKIFGGSSQLFVASMIAYLIGQFLDIQVFQYWKALTQSRHLWLRATGSTILSQAIDTSTINVVFWRWTGGREWGWIFAKIVREYGIKLVIAVCLTPIVYALHALIVRWLRIEPEKHEGRGAPA
jgi:queuosine precursor transporter